jgi:hypothetical protein
MLFSVTCDISEIVINHILFPRLARKMQSHTLYFCVFALASGSSEWKDASEDMRSDVKHATVYIEEPADGEVINLSSGQDSIDLVAFADGTNITSDCIFLMQLDERRPMLYRFLAFAADTNRGMLHTQVRDIASICGRAMANKLTMSVGKLEPGESGQTARILAWTSISFRVHCPPNPSTKGDLSQRALEPLLGIRSGFAWSHANASSILSGPWPLPCPQLPVRVSVFY